MFKSSGYFKGVTCPYFASGLCERTYCHFRHVKSDQNTDENELTGNEAELKASEGSMLGMVSGAIKQVQRDTASHSTSVFQKLESVKWYKPTPIPKHGSNRHRQSNKNANIPEYNPTPLHVLKKAQTPNQDAKATPVIPAEKVRNPIISRKIKQEKCQVESDSESGYEPVLDKKSASVPAYKPTPRISPPTIQSGLDSGNKEADLTKPQNENTSEKVHENAIGENKSNDVCTEAPRLHEKSENIRQGSSKYETEENESVAAAAETRNESSNRKAVENKNVTTAKDEKTNDRSIEQDSRTATDDDIVSINTQRADKHTDTLDDAKPSDNLLAGKGELSSETSLGSGHTTDGSNSEKDKVNNESQTLKHKNENEKEDESLGNKHIGKKSSTSTDKSPIVETTTNDSSTGHNANEIAKENTSVNKLLENVVIKQEKVDVILIESGSDGTNRDSKSRKSSRKKTKHSSRDKNKGHKSRSSRKSSSSRNKDKKSSKKHSSRSKSSHNSKKKRKHDRKRSRSSSSSTSYSSSSESSSSSRSRSKRRHSSSSHRNKYKKHSSKSKSSKSRSSRSKHKKRRHSSFSSSSSRSRSRSKSKRRRSSKHDKGKPTVVQGYIKTIRGVVATEKSKPNNGNAKATSKNEGKNIFETFASESAKVVIKTEKPDSFSEQKTPLQNLSGKNQESVNKSKTTGENSTKEKVQEPKSKPKSPKSSSQKQSKPVYKKAVSCADLFGNDSESDKDTTLPEKIQNQPVSENKVTSTQNDKSSKNKTAEPAIKKGRVHVALLKERESDSESVVLSASDDNETDEVSSDFEPNRQSDENLDKSLEIPDSVLADLENEMSEEDPFDECFQIFNDAKSKSAQAAIEREREMKVQKQKKAKENEDEESAQGLGKIRVARGNESASRSTLQQRIANARLGGAQPSPAQVLHNRLMSQQQQLQKRAERKRSLESEQHASSGLDGKRQRVAHQPSSSSGTSLQAHLKQRQAKSGKKDPTPCGTISKYLTKGTKREAHVPTVKKSIPRPTVPADFGSKVPSNVRQVYLNKMIDECLKIYPEETSAYDRALAEEKEAYNRAGNKKIYLNVAVNCIKKLRNEATPTSSVTSPTKNPRGMSHETLLGGAKALKTHFTIKRSSVYVDPNRELSVSEFYDHLRAYILTEEQQVENGYPRPDPDHPKQVIIFTDDEKTKNKISPNKRERFCTRCARRFQVDANGELVSRETCTFHWGKSWKRRITKGVFENKWTCCGGDVSTKGCHVGTAHVHEQNKYEDLKGYVRMLESSTTPLDGNYGVYALDCEMVYTTMGQEIARVTVVDMKGESILEQLILPGHPVTDYNTRFSGISEKDMKNVGINLRDVQAMLMSLFNKKTILIGHSLESDLIALKVVHDNVVDTSVVFPHRLGKPYKRALKTLMAEILQRIIQEDVGGHDSLEDAVSCMDLMKWKVKEDIKKEIRQAHAQS